MTNHLVQFLQRKCYPLWEYIGTCLFNYVQDKLPGHSKFASILKKWSS